MLITDILNIRRLEPAAELLIMAVAWPLRLFGYLFPPDELVFGPTKEALLASVILDVLIYSTLTYIYLSLRAPRKVLS